MGTGLDTGDLLEKISQPCVAGTRKRGKCCHWPWRSLKYQVEKDSNKLGSVRAKILDLDAKRSAPVDGLASRPGVPSPPPPSSPQIGQGGLNVTSQEVRKGFEKKLFKKLTNDLV